MTKKQLTILKHSGLAALIIGCVILTYCTIGCFIVWTWQPLFVSAVDTSRSMGFVVVGTVHAVLLLLLMTGTFLYAYFLYIKPNKKHKLSAQKDSKK